VDPDEYEQHSVNELRNLLWDYGLDMDGSCQTLINRLMKKKLDEIEAQKARRMKTNLVVHISYPL
jgi:hypothetical protein